MVSPLRGAGAWWCLSCPCLPCACGSKVAPVLQRAAGAGRGRPAASPPRPTWGSDFTSCTVNGSTVSDMRKNRSAALSARTSEGLSVIGVRGGRALDQQLRRADPRHHLRHQGMQRLDGYDDLEVACGPSGRRRGQDCKGGEQDRDGHAWQCRHTARSPHRHRFPSGRTGPDLTLPPRSGLASRNVIVYLKQATERANFGLAPKSLQSHGHLRPARHGFAKPFGTTRRP